MVAGWSVATGNLAWHDESPIVAGRVGPGLARCAIVIPAGSIGLLHGEDEKAKLELLEPESGRVVAENSLDLPLLVNSAGLAPSGGEFAAMDQKGKIHRFSLPTGQILNSWHGRLGHGS